ncbi:MAG: FeoA family protein [Myxococcota bacterium]
MIDAHHIKGSSANLDELKPGSGGVVQQVGGLSKVSRRLMEMGLVPGTHVTVTRFAALGDPVELRLRGYALCIRRSEASQITITDLCHHEPVL